MPKDTILVVDVECTCWDKPSEIKGQIQEIIEIGICAINRNSLKPTNRKSIIVRPQHSTISSFCEGLTGIKQEDVDVGINFPDAVNALKRDFLSQNTCMASWGNFDQTQFEKDCALHGIDYPFNRTHLNIKHLFSWWKNCRECGISDALRKIGLEFIGTPHSGEDDAFNAARILIEIIKSARK